MGVRGGPPVRVAIVTLIVTQPSSCPRPEQRPPFGGVTGSSVRRGLGFGYPVSQKKCVGQRDGCDQPAADQPPEVDGQAACNVRLTGGRPISDIRDAGRPALALAS